MKIWCKVFGHDPVKGEIQRSPYTSYTHWQETHCRRCGIYLESEKLYFDARTQPEMFKDER
jgi:hypothetical protein